MADYNFNTPENQTIARELLLLYLNTGTKDAPVWSLIGHRVEDSSMELDWQRESVKDIVGATRNTMKKPIITQTFEPWELDSADAAQKKIWNIAVKDQDSAAIANQDLLVVHAYAGTANTAVFAERYPSSLVKVSGLGGSANVGMPIDVVFGGERKIGTAALADGTVTFTAA